MNNIYCQYEIALPDEYSDYVVKKMCELMHIHFENEKYNDAMKCEDLYSFECICIFHDKENNNRFVMLDTCGPNFIHNLIIRCCQSEHDYIKKLLLNFLNEVKSKYGHEPSIDLKDRYNARDNCYNRALKRCNVDIL